jgi:hypothetical protein
MTAPNILNGRRSTFEKIEEISRVLLAKGAIAQFVDKDEDSGAVAALVERLRQAIVCYQASEDCTLVSSTVDMEEQISQQQAIYHQITHLAVSLLRLVAGTDPDRSVSQVIV